jgi:drug/metabolite transporter (DMT)-like permease
MRWKWVGGWLFVLLGVVGVTLGAVSGSMGELLVGDGWIVLGGVHIAASIRHGARPWRRRADGSLPD